MSKQGLCVQNSTRHDTNSNNYNNVSMSKYSAQVQQGQAGTRTTTSA